VSLHQIAFKVNILPPMASSVTHMASQAEFLPVLDGGAHGASMHITRLDQRLNDYTHGK